MATSNYGAKKKKKMEKQAVVDVPDDLIVQILSWVPARTLLQLRWACKYWFNLITSDPSFVKLHLQHSKLVINNISILILHSHGHILPGHRLHDHSLSVPITERKLLGYKVWGSSCNGLFCIYMFKLDAICLWNPCTNELKIIPDSPLTRKDENDDTWVITCGHGYCSNIDDYKVIKKTITCSMSGSLEIYSLRANSWRTVFYRDDPYTFYHGWSNGVGLHLDGSLYLQLRGADHDIVCFDIEREEYRQLLMPERTATQRMEIGALQGCLCMLKYELDVSVMEIWMTKDCGRTKENWIKSFTIMNPMVKEILTYNYDDKYTPMEFNENGELLLRHEKYSELFWYNPKSDRTRHVAEVPTAWSKVETYTETLVWSKVETYTETLVSLNSGV